MTAAPDRWASWDAAYVLGALSSRERHEFEEHLAACDRCAEAVSELAGVPGLLAQVDPQDLVRLIESPVVTAEPPPSLRNAVVGWPRRRVLGIVVGIAAGVSLLIGGIGIGTSIDRGGSDAPRRVAFNAVEPSTITAVVDLVPVASGTDVSVECQYGGEASTGLPDPDYLVVVVGRDGRPQEIKRWPVRPNKVMHPGAPTSLRLSQIASVEIRRADSGETVLRAPVS